MKSIPKPLPFFDERACPIDMIVFHCNAFAPNDFIKTLEQARLSCHYIIDTAGSLYQCVAEDKRAWHAGAGFWRGIQEDINSHSIGIELTSPTLGQTPYPAPQIQTLIHLCQQLIQKYHIPTQNIIGHSDMAPTRKPDPGFAFPWKTLAENGIGLWPAQAQSDVVLPEVRTHNAVSFLKQIGYDTRTRAARIASAYAFQKRFMPTSIRMRKNIRSLILHPMPRTRTKIPSSLSFLKTVSQTAAVFK